MYYCVIFSITHKCSLIFMQDFGYVQTTSTEVLKSYVFNAPVMIDAARMPSLGPAAIFMV